MKAPPIIDAEKWVVSVEFKRRELALAFIAKVNELGHIAILKEPKKEKAS